MRPLSLSICGGHAGQAWLCHHACGQVPGLSVHGVFDDDPEQSELRAEAWGCHPYEEMERACSDPASDALVLLSGDPLGRQPTVDAALSAGKHLLLAPPVALNADQARRLFDRAQAAGVRLMAHHPALFAPPLVKARELLNTEAVGQPSTARFRSFIAGSGGWDRRLSPGCRAADQDAPGPTINPTADLTAALTVARTLLGPIEELFAHGEIEGDAPHATVSWKHRAHATYGVLELTVALDASLRSAHDPREDSCEITGSSGLMWLHLGPGRMRAEPALRLYQRENLLSYQALDEDPLAGHVASLAHFAELVRGKNAPCPSPDQTVDVAACLAAALESLKTGSRQSIG